MAATHFEDDHFARNCANNDTRINMSEAMQTTHATFVGWPTHLLSSSLGIDTRVEREGTRGGCVSQGGERGPLSDGLLTGHACVPGVCVVSGEWCGWVSAAVAPENCGVL